jgi:hypothetical protein
VPAHSAFAALEFNRQLIPNFIGNDDHVSQQQLPLLIYLALCGCHGKLGLRILLKAGFCDFGCREFFGVGQVLCLAGCCHLAFKHLAPNDITVSRQDRGILPFQHKLLAYYRFGASL